MPGMQMQLGARMQLQQRIQLQMALGPDDMIDPFRTEGEQVQISQYALIQEMIRQIDSGEYFDTDHFTLEINRTIFGHPLEARLGTFGKDLADLVQFYDSDEELAKRMLQAIGAQKEDAERKDIPGLIAAAWNRTNNSEYFRAEPRQRKVIELIEILQDKKADIAAGIDIISKATALEQQRNLVEITLEKVRAYSTTDARIITFAQHIASPVFRAISRRKKERLDQGEATAVYTGIIESLYTLDRDLRVSGTVEKIAEIAQKQGLGKLLSSQLPIPIQVALDATVTDEKTIDAIVKLCQDPHFAQGRELKRKIYRGIAAAEELERGSEIIAHIATHATESRSLASMLSALALVSHEQQFEYPFNATGEKDILQDLKMQLVDKSVKRLELDNTTLERYITAVESDERFERIGKIITTLAGYSHYQNNEQTALLREIVEAELAGKFQQWRYMHNRAKDQLKVLDDRPESWKENTKTIRIVGELDALRSHIESIKNVLPKIQETYSTHYSRPSSKDVIQELEEKISSNEEKLRQEGLSNKERKDLGQETHMLREQLAYTELITGISELNPDNYPDMMEKAEAIVSKRSKNPLYENARWIRETLDQPAYRDARKITVYETDDLETLLRFGETPVVHCQNWKVDSALNRSLLSFVADANKKLYHIANGDDTPIAMSLMRLVPWEESVTLLLENVYDKEWSEDYGIALLGSVADKALATHKDTGKEVRVATNNERLLKAMKKFSKKYKVEIHEGYVHTDPAQSKNKYEYWDCGPGIKESASSVAFEVNYISFGGDKE
jgi:hypothetical protein